MTFYQDLNELDKTVFRRRGLLFLFLLNIFVLALVASYGFSAWKDFRTIIRGEDRLQINVTGEGKVIYRPDVAKLNATILTENEFLKVAQEENSKKSNVLVSYLKSAGLEEKDIKTTGYNIYPQYSYPPPCPPYSVCPLDSDRPKIIGYQVRNSYEITIRDISKAGEILSGVVGSGVNEVSSLVFTIDQPEALKAEARKKAIDDARAKAEKLADDLNRRLGKIMNFYESTFPPPIVFREMVLGKGGGAEPVPTPSIRPGENEIVVSVSVTYEFR